MAKGCRWQRQGWERGGARPGQSFARARGNGVGEEVVMEPKAEAINQGLQGWDGGWEGLGLWLSGGVGGGHFR